MLLVPVAYEKYDKLARLARALKEIRVGFILTGTGVAFSLLIAYAAHSPWLRHTADVTLYADSLSLSRHGHNLAAKTLRTTPAQKKPVKTL